MTTRAHSPVTPRSAGGSPSLRTWRATTATRVFGVALATGSALDTEVLTRSVPALMALLLLAVGASVIDMGRVVDRSTWVPVVEAMLAATLLAGVLPGDALLTYLAVPAVVAGIAHGWATAVNATLAGAISFYATTATVSDRLVVQTELGTPALWLAVGVGAGLLAGWQTRSLRQVETRQAPYAAAHRLVAQLSDLTRSRDVALDSIAAARELGTELTNRFDCSHWAVYADSTDGMLEPLARTGDLPHLHHLALQHRGRRRGSWHHGSAALPLRVGDHAFGVVVLERKSPWNKQDLGVAQAIADELAVRVETSLLFDQVRDLATADERNRLARDIHDGIAQEMVALGYLVDEIEDTSAEPDTLRNAATMRQEISRLIGELRMSIFDLRHEIDQRHLSGALAEYVREVSAGTGLRVHLVLDEQGEQLPSRVESELLRIAQEAIGNVRRHAHAQNLWVTFNTDGVSLRLEVADDGVGGAVPRQRHYGLHTMVERAELLDSELAVRERPGGGTVVTVTSRSPAPGNTRHPIATLEMTPTRAGVTS